MRCVNVPRCTKERQTLQDLLGRLLGACSLQLRLQVSTQDAQMHAEVGERFITLGH